MTIRRIVLVVLGIVVVALVGAAAWLVWPQANLPEADAALEDQPPHEEEEGEERRVSLHNRALPLIEMLEAARDADVPVMWE